MFLHMGVLTNNFLVLSVPPTKRGRETLNAPWLNFINILCTAFMHVDPECAKKDSQVSSVIWRF